MITVATGGSSSHDDKTIILAIMCCLGQKYKSACVEPFLSGESAHWNPVLDMEKKIKIKIYGFLLPDPLNLMLYVSLAFMQYVVPLLA